MTIQDVLNVIEELKKEKTDLEILIAFSRLYFDDKIDFNGYEGLVNLLGYSLDEDFKKLTKEEQYKWFLEDIKK